MNAMGRMTPPQSGHTSGSTSKTFLMKRAQLPRAVLAAPMASERDWDRSQRLIRHPLPAAWWSAASQGTSRLLRLPGVLQEELRPIDP